jgi:hypothetical protein
MMTTDPKKASSDLCDQLSVQAETLRALQAGLHYACHAHSNYPASAQREEGDTFAIVDAVLGRSFDQIRAVVKALEEAMDVADGISMAIAKSGGAR